MKTNLEKFYLLIFFGILMYLGPSNLWDHKLSHDFPYGYLASDTFQQQTRAEGIMAAGNYRYEPFFIVKGFRDAVGYYTPVLHHLGILLHYASGVPLYDTIYFMVFFAAILGAFVMYVIIGSYNKQIAILSLPLSILIFSNKSFIGFLWGHWASITAQLFLISSFWAMSKLHIGNMEIILGLFLGAVAMTHTPILIHVALFIILYSVFLSLTGRFDLAYAKKMVIAGLIAGLISIYNLFIFYNGFMVVNPYKFEVSLDWGGTPIFYMSDFGWLLVPIIIGVAAGLLLIKKSPIPVIPGVYMIFAGYTNYIGFGIRAFQPRLLWPIYLSFFFGLGIYMLIKYIPQKFRYVSVYATCALSIVLLLGAIPLPNVMTYSKVSTPGLMDLKHWEAFRWLSQNTPEDAKIYFFYGDVYDQDAILRNSMRFHAQVVPQDFVMSIQNRTIKRVYKSEVPADHAAGAPYFKSFLKMGLHLRETKDPLLTEDYLDICLFDYMVFDIATRQPVLAEYNKLIAAELLKKSYITHVYGNENDYVFILRNNNVGADCIEQREF